MINIKTFDNGIFNNIPFGKQRRKLILLNINWRFHNGMPGLPVNNQWQMHTKYDNDLKYLLKKGKLKIIRRKKYQRKSQTWLVENK